ncbi:MAG: hypothetical protein LC772_03650, partial [Chloroflexi bacterium]|nr:hypothetical protein [Chloroflexota bacterium]
MSQQTNGHVIVAHDAVPGRTRFRIQVMRESPSLATVLQDRLLHTDGVQSVAASPLTGTLLVIYDPLLATSAALVDSLEAALRESPWVTGSASAVEFHPRPAPPAPRPDSRIKAKAPAQVTAAVKSLRRTLPSLKRPGGREKAVSLSEPWHHWTPDAVAAHFRTRPSSGLPQAQAVRRMGTYGRNEVPDIPRRPRSAILMEQVSSIPGLMLTAAATFSFLTGAVTDAVLIAGAVVA